MGTSKNLPHGLIASPTKDSSQILAEKPNYLRYKS
jgi:hypothetical protein